MTSTHELANEKMNSSCNTQLRYPYNEGLHEIKTIQVSCTHLSLKSTASNYVSSFFLFVMLDKLHILCEIGLTEMNDYLYIVHKST